MGKRVLVGIPSKDRLLEISILLSSLTTQTYTDFDILIVNDCHGSNYSSNKTFSSLCEVLKYLGHDVKIIEGDRRGPHIAGQKIFDSSEKYELIFRLDDDVCLEPDVIEELIKIFDTYPNVGCTGPVYIDPALDIEKQWIPKDCPREFISEQCKVKWVNNNELFLTGWAQTNQHHDLTPIQTEHLNSGFLYKREAVERIGGYFLDFSICGHREESDLSYRIFRQGYNLYIAPSAIAWHFHPMSGGIRETAGVSHQKINWDHDEKLFLERMEQWLPKDNKIKEDIFVSVIILTYGDHNKLRLLLNDIKTYTNHPNEIIIINNDDREESKKDFTENISNEFSSQPIKLLQLVKPLAVGEARTLGVKYTNEKSKYICFIDDDARILGRYNQTTDWLDYLYNRFHTQPDVGAVSPIYTWMDELQCHCVSVACMFTSKRVWSIVGGFDSVFGNKENGTWAMEDSDWSYRCESAGFKLLGVDVNDYPFYHHNTVGDHTNYWYTEGIKKSYKLLLSKYNVEITEGENDEGKISLLKDEKKNNKFSGPIHDFCRTVYPFTKAQIEMPGTKLNVGCYYMHLDGFINVDINAIVKPELVCNMLEIDRHFAPNSVSLILISQCLEHVTKEEGIQTLMKFYRILAPGGYLIVEVPDGNDLDGRLNRGEISREMYNLLMTGHKEVEYQGHESIYETYELREILVNIGYTNIQSMPLEMTSDKVEAIRIDCRKP